MTNTRQTLRSSFRRQRAQLNHGYRRAAAKRIARRLLHTLDYQRCQRIALYCPYGSEVDVWPIIHTAHKAQKHVYLPQVRGTSMRFVRFEANTPLRRKAFGILEPFSECAMTQCLTLDLVIVPLVAFDQHGGRLGQGGGYYDRHFASLKNASWRKPKLFGAAYEIQRCAKIVLQPWDVSLDAVFTEKSIYRS